MEVEPRRGATRSGRTALLALLLPYCPATAAPPGASAHGRTGRTGLSYRLHVTTWVGAPRLAARLPTASLPSPTPEQRLPALRLPEERLEQERAHPSPVAALTFSRLSTPDCIVPVMVGVYTLRRDA